MKVYTSFLPTEYLRQGNNILCCDGVSLLLEMGAREFLDPHCFSYNRKKCI